MKHLAAITTILLCLSSSAQNYSTDDVKLLSEIEKLFSEYHIDYQTLSPQIGERFPNQLVLEIDPDALYITKIEADEITSGLQDFSVGQSFTRTQLERIRTILESSLLRTISMLESLDNLDFYKDDTVFLMSTHEPLTHTSGDDQLKNRWVKQIKLDVLLANNDSTLFGNT